MNTIKFDIRKLLIAILLAGLVGIFFFFYYFGHGDTRKLNAFTAAYENYDHAISSYSSAILMTSNIASLGNQEQIAVEAVNQLQSAAKARISSLTKNDADLMDNALEIAALATQELSALRSYEDAAANHSPDVDSLADGFREISSQRITTYEHFRLLAESGE